MLINKEKSGKTYVKSNGKHKVKLKNAGQRKRNNKFYTYIRSSMWKTFISLRKEQDRCEKLHTEKEKISENT